MSHWDKTAQYYERLASQEGRDPYSQRALLWYAQTCHARNDFERSIEKSAETDIRPRSAARPI